MSSKVSSKKASIDSAIKKVSRNKNKKREKKVIESLRALFLSHLGRTFPLIKPLNRQ